jgi:PAS domain S-box-containing protein
MAEAQILIVEDNNIVAIELRDRLQGLGYTIAALTSSGEEAIEKAAETRPDLVLMDIRLKGDLNGMEAAEEIRAHFDIPVVYLTACTDENTLQRAKITEPYGYILKPFEARGLHSTIEIALYKHKIERKLKESERWLATTLKSIGDAVIATDIKGYVRFMNPVAEALTGWKQEDALGKDFTEVFNIVDEETRALTESPITKALREGVIASLEDHTLIAKDGREMAVDNNAAPIRDDKGNVAGAVLVFRDITEHKRAEEALEHRTAQLALINHIGRRIAAALDLDQVLQSIVDSAPRLISAGTSAVIHLTDKAAGKLIPRATSAPEINFQEKLGMSIGRGIAGLVAQEKRLINVPDVEKDPRFLPMDIPTSKKSLLTAPLLVDGDCIGTLSLSSDQMGAFSSDDERLLTTLAAQAAIAVRNARLYQEVQSRVEELVFLNRVGRAVTSSLDLKQVLTTVMREAIGVLKVEAASVLLLHEEDEELVLETVVGPRAEEVKGLRVPLGQGVAGWVAREGQRLLVPDVGKDPRFYSSIDRVTGFTTRSVLCVPLKLKKKVIGVIEAVNKTEGYFSQADVALLSSMAQSAAIAIENARLYKDLQDQMDELKQTQAQLLHTEKMSALGRLAASLTHEINNPLQSVIGCLDLAKEELAEGENVDEYLRIAREEVQRVAHTVAQMRDLSRPASEKKGPTEVNALVEQVLELSRKRCDENQVEVVWKPAADLPRLLLMADQIKQVFLNFLLNAIEAMPGGGQLRVSTAYTSHPAGVRIEFTDNGVGIAPDALPQVFEPFYSTKPEGIGLGLSISYTIVERHGGHIEVESRVGEGSTFTVWLPA